LAAEGRVNDQQIWAGFVAKAHNGALNAAAPDPDTGARDKRMRRKLGKQLRDLRPVPTGMNADRWDRAHAQTAIPTQPFLISVSVCRIFATEFGFDIDLLNRPAKNFIVVIRGIERRLFFEEDVGRIVLGAWLRLYVFLSFEGRAGILIVARIKAVQTF